MLALDAGRLEEFSSEAVGAVGARDTGRPAPISEPARVPFAVTKRAGCRHSHGCLSSQRRTPGAWVHSITPNGVAFGDWGEPKPAPPGYCGAAYSTICAQSGSFSTIIWAHDRAHRTRTAPLYG